MITVLVDVGTAFTLGSPFIYIGWRLKQFRSATRNGKVPHIFEPHIRKDMHGPHTMKWCDVCNQGRKALIHTHRQSSDAAEGNYLDRPALLKLEIDDIKWRFANDPEWVKVFGDEYDPKTFQPIPQFHNGECGGPHDSCERCAWEADQEEAEFKRAEKRKESDQYLEAARRKAAEQKLIIEESKGYADVLWTLWNTTSSPEEAREDFDEIRDELGMLKNHALRTMVLESDIFQRLNWCLYQTKDYAEKWYRREEVWAKRVKERKDRERSRYGYHGLDF